jgi:hypothetical protein
MASPDTRHPVAEQVTCEVCKSEIPLSEAKRFEAEDYVAYFCGLDCYSEWKRSSEKLDRHKKE